MKDQLLQLRGPYPPHHLQKWKVSLEELPYNMTIHSNSKFSILCLATIG